MTRSELLKKLKEKRKEIADAEGKELFMVFQNRTLEETVKAMPQTREDLALVKGWGKTKISKYGDEILALLKQVNNVADKSLLQENPLSFDKEINTSIRKIDHEMKKQLHTVFSVSEFVEVVNITFERLGPMRVQGEVSEMQIRGSAVYFSLKDTAGGEAMVKCLLWKWQFDQYYSYLADGHEVVIEGVPEVYEKYGTFSIKVSRLEPVGEGALLKAYEALKKKYEQAGFFDSNRKRTLPHIIQRIGIVTSLNGEAINDFNRNVGNYGFNIFAVDVRVEGVYAEDHIVKGIQWINTHGINLDVLVLIRGGGGLENLKAFNSERVAEAILNSRLPVLTGIGHERDETISGLIADANYSTPTAVAVYIRRIREDLIIYVNEYDERITLAYGDLIESMARLVNEQKKVLTLAYKHILMRYRQSISAHARTMRANLSGIFNGFKFITEKFRSSFYRFESYTQAQQRFVAQQAIECTQIMERVLQKREKLISVEEVMLISLDPTAPLKRGYSITYNEHGRVLKDVKGVTIGEWINVRLHEGSIRAKVDEKK